MGFSYSERREEEEKLTAPANNALEQFVETPSKVNLVALMKTFDDEGVREIFRNPVSNILDELSDDSLDWTLINEFPGLEYETKISLGTNLDLKGIDFYLLQGSIYLPDFQSNFRATENQFFGTDEGESLVVTRRARLNDIILKYKGLPEDFTTDNGINNFVVKNFVVKRKEYFKEDCSEDEATREVLRVYGNGSTFRGSIRRERECCQIISSETGRVYIVIVDECIVAPVDQDEFRRYQAEVEYKGALTTDYKGLKLGSEKQMARELIDLSSKVKDFFKAKKQSKVSAQEINFTNKTKYDFLR